MEDLIASGAVSPNAPLISVILTNNIISILNPLSRDQTGGRGGGNFVQTYVRREPRDPCPSLDKYLQGAVGSTLKIELWLNYQAFTKPITEWGETR